jgi:hypothetical protein
MGVSGVRVPVEDVADAPHRGDCCEAFQTGQHSRLGQGSLGHLNRRQAAVVVDALDPVSFPQRIGGPVFDMHGPGKPESLGVI